MYLSLSVDIIRSVILLVWYNIVRHVSNFPLFYVNLSNVITQSVEYQLFNEEISIHASTFTLKPN